MKGFWKGLIATLIIGALCIALIPSLNAQVGTITRRLIGTQDVYFATGGTGAAETFAYVDPSGNTLTLTKPDATHLKYRTAVEGATQSVENSVTAIYVADRYGTAQTNATMTLALTAIGSDQATLKLLPGTWTISADIIIPANVTLKPEKGAILSIATTKTVTINGTLDAGLYQIFSCTGTGKVDFGPGAIKEVYPEWWGAVPGSYAGTATTPDSAAAITAAAASITNGIVRLSSGTYLVDTAIVLPDYITLAGAGMYATTVMPTSLCSIAAAANRRASVIQSGGTHTQITIKDLTVDGNSANNAIAVYNGIGISEFNPTTGLPVTWGANVLLDNVRVHHVPNNAVSHTGCGFHVHADDVMVRNCIADNDNAGFWMRGYRHKYYGLVSHDNLNDGIDTYCDDLLIDGCSVYSNAGTGINPTGNISSPVALSDATTITGNQNLKIIGCNIYSNTGDGISMPNAFKFHVVDNTVVSNGGGIAATGGISGFIARNLITSATDGIAVGTQTEAGPVYQRGYDVIVSENILQNTDENITITGVVANLASRIMIVNNDIQSGAVGITFKDSNNEGCVIEGNLFDSNTADITLNGSYARITDNAGYNPQTPVTPAVPASATPYQNAFGYPIMVCITGGGEAVTEIAKGPVSASLVATGLTVNATSTHATVILAPAEYISMTYAGAAPTWVFFGL